MRPVPLRKAGRLLNLLAAPGACAEWRAQRSSMNNAKRPAVQRLALLLFVVVPLAAWVLVKPVRVLAPGLVGIACGAEAPVCVDDPQRLQAANALHAEAVAFVSNTVAPLQRPPRVIFCSTNACADSFGLGARSAVTVANWGIVIGPRAWKPYYVRHELIHVLQGQRLGVMRRLFMPTWFVEGMAYGLSLDPRAPLAEPWERHRARFNAWAARIPRDQWWQEAGKL